MKPNKERLDVLLCQRGLFASREKAQRAIMAGVVRVDGEVADKPGVKVVTDAAIGVAGADKFVGRGGYKLEAALDAFHVDPSGLACLDIGASTGGFTDCLLQRGAACVHAVDVGHGQLDWKLRNDPRVVVREKFNARHMGPADFPAPFDLAVVDVSFISLRLILPPAFSVLRPGRLLLALIKPQFEVGRGEVGKGGVVRNPALHNRVVAEFQAFVDDDLQQGWRGVVESPIKGADGNLEFLACLEKLSD